MDKTVKSATIFFLILVVLAVAKALFNPHWIFWAVSLGIVALWLVCTFLITNLSDPTYPMQGDM